MFSSVSASPSSSIFQLLSSPTDDTSVSLVSSEEQNLNVDQRIETPNQTRDTPSSSEHYPDSTSSLSPICPLSLRSSVVDLAELSGETPVDDLLQNADSLDTTLVEILSSVGQRLLTPWRPPIKVGCKSMRCVVRAKKSRSLSMYGIP